ncbi:hypothetical protein B0H34DRAFT_785236 [Crassisporium funariophilum]|nr:hypothetical protein B0H34DRAFT_785236 [Crassisporium funariophilum]
MTPPPGEEEEEEDKFTYVRHPVLTGKPCDANGRTLPPHAPPAPVVEDEPSWEPFEDRTAFEFAHYHFVEVQSSVEKIHRALDIWAASVLPFGKTVPWKTADELYATIDDIQQGECPWKTYELRYSGALPDDPPSWMTETFELVTRCSRTLLLHQLATTDFNGKIRYGPYMQFDSKGRRVWSDLLSGDWAHKQADIIAQLPESEGAMFVPIVAGSDKTTVSVATGHQEYHPVYMSPGCITNIARRAHGNGLLPVAFLPIPKTSKNHRKDGKYATFVRQMYHACLAQVFAPLKAGMTTPEIVRCPDGHLRRAYYGLGPYIADYPEQVWLAGIVQWWCPKCDARPDYLDDPSALRRTRARTEFFITCFDPGILWGDYGIRPDITPFTNYFPRADIHELLSPDLLHQVIKGTFKDHLVTWVGDYLVITHGEARALPIIQDIDRRISAVPAFPGLRRFPDGRDFSQWTGDDSKALMKVYLAAITGHVPPQMVKCFAAFLDFCYIARRNALCSDDITELEAALSRFHQHRSIFIETGVRIGISLPRQHALKHYARSIRLFGSPNGLCSSITESKHIKAVKEPWRRSNRFNALSQMLRTLSRLDKIAAVRRQFERWGMMVGSAVSYMAMLLAGGAPEPQVVAPQEAEEDDDLGPVSGPKVLSSVKLARTPERDYPKTLKDLADHISQPAFPVALRRFLWDQLHPDSEVDSNTIPVDELPDFRNNIKMFHSAVAQFYAPSDLCGTGGMCKERIRAHPNWRGEYARNNTVFVEINADMPGMQGMVIGRVLLFFSFLFDGDFYPCALVNWLVRVGDVADPETGMWVVKPEFDGRRRSLAVVHIECIARAAHLLPVYGSSRLPEDFHFSLSLDVFRAYFVNCYVDHHTHEFLK